MSYLVKSPHEQITFAKSEPFTNPDTAEMFARNLKRLGPSWIWAKRSFTYTNNSLGYRMNKELEEVDFDNYFAFFGCSYCVGVGLPLEETYAYRIAKRYNVDYVNAGTGGGNVDFAHINFVKLFTEAPKLPKAVIVNWPELTRTCFWTKTDGEDRLEMFLSNHIDDNSQRSLWKNTYKEFVMNENQINNRFTTIRQTFQTMCKLAGVKLFEFTSHQTARDFSKRHPGITHIPMFPHTGDQKSIQYYNLCRARDIDPVTNICHPGIYHQSEVLQTVSREMGNAFN